MVSRVLVTKKPGFDVEAQHTAEDIREFLGIDVEGVVIVNRYDVEDLAPEILDKARSVVFSEPPVDDIIDGLPAADCVIATELLPGQFDMRASSAAECIQLMAGCDQPLVRSAKIYLFKGSISAEDEQRLKHYLINPVEMREASLDMPETLVMPSNEVKPVADVELLGLDDAALAGIIDELGLSMDLADLKFTQDYFAKEGRNPTLTEVRVIDTYWSDHCRHTTFNTHLENIEIEDEDVKAAFERYLKLKEECGRADRPITLMEIGTIAGRVLKQRGIMKNLDESDEINACTVKCKVDVDGEQQDWLYLFKNETHNHPTEIEPFGGAATCIGGAIRDPLSGRAYVYQSMRITGAADPLVPISETREGKLPQRKLTTTAAKGFSSYGNQIGLATGIVHEIYHPGYEAKRMELGAVVAAAPADAVIRECPQPGDVVILLGGRTGRDGIGGATGSSKSHHVTSLETCGSEVQKGNAPTERKLQCLFRNPEATKLIIRCNDFGAGGVSVAIGELADGLDINLDAVRTKYDGLDGTELAISESQERMACVVHPESVDKFLELAEGQNLEAYVVATVTAEPRMVQTFKGQRVVDLSREFLDSNGAPKQADAHVAGINRAVVRADELSPAQQVRHFDYGPTFAAQRGLTQMFDSTIGASSVISPLGGKYRATPAIAMVSKLPVPGETNTVSGMAWGFDPYLTSEDPYTGAYSAVLDSITKLVCAGFSRKDAYLTFQEYFKKLGTEPDNWGEVLSAVLGALDAQMDLEIAAIGGKDSMSGTFDDISVPPTLVSFATALSRADIIISPEFKEAGSAVVFAEADGAAAQNKLLDTLYELIAQGKILSASTPAEQGIVKTIFEMCLGNRIGFDFESYCDSPYGSVVLEVKPELADEVVAAFEDAKLLGHTKAEFAIDDAELMSAEEQWERLLEPVFPSNILGGEVEVISSDKTAKSYTGIALGTAKPKVIIPVFPGTNCEFDTARAFRAAGAEPEIFRVNNLTSDLVMQSVHELAGKINESQILMIPGGFSGGDEPDGSAKFIASFLRSPEIAEAITGLLEDRDGLALGICNGFQALVKLGLLPYGKICDIKESDATLTYNLIGHHESALINTRVSSLLSPWFSRLHVGDQHTIAISHGEGRFVCSDEMLEQLKANGQVCAQYVDLDGKADTSTLVCPNGAMANIEAICSPDGRVLGKMGHSERRGTNLYKNIPGNKYQELFEGGVDYFKL